MLYNKLVIYTVTDIGIDFSWRWGIKGERVNLFERSLVNGTDTKPFTGNSLNDGRLSTDSINRQKKLNDLTTASPSSKSSVWEGFL